MKTIKLFLFTYLIFFCHLAQAQVKTNFNNETLITIQGRFAKDYKTQIDFELPSKNIDELLEKEKNEIAKSSEIKPFQLAVPVSVDLDIPKLTNWIYDKEYAYCKFTVKLNGALSASINFDKFYLPKATEMYVYNGNGNMITGPITENENNNNKIWGSWVYRGQFLSIEIKTPISLKEQLLLHSNNIAYGYKEVYKTKVGGFGNSGACNINVLCPLGNGWEPERNSVALILDATGQYWCSGSMVMNTCNTNQPFFLTANHCYATNPVQNLSAWRFTFQAWSATCTPSQNSDGVIYNGSTLRANWANTDFCLVELNNTPPTNSGINYSGWTRSTTPAQNATGIHHPSGDVMKISRAANPVSIASAFGTTNQHWRADWTQGVTEGGSSGSPLYDQNHRIIGQLHGGPSACGASQLWDFYGRLDLSWTGGGTNATRLSDWLDPNNSGATTINTTNVVALTPFLDVNTLNIAGPQIICNTSDYSITNLPVGATVTWSIPGSAGPVLQLSPNTPLPNQLRITNMQWYTVTTTLTAIISNLGCGIDDQTRTLTIANDNSNAYYPYYQEACYFYNVYHPEQSGTAYSNQTPTFVHQGCMVYVNLGAVSGTVTLAPNSGQPLYWSVGATYYPNTLYFQLPIGSGGVPFIFEITGNGSCFTRSLLFFSYSNNERYVFAAVPNPVKDILTVTAKKNEDLPLNSKAESTKETLKFIMNIYDVNTNNLQISERSTSGSLLHQLNISRLKTGYYVLQIVEGNQKHAIKFFKE